MDDIRTQPQPAQADAPTVALVSYDSLGDGLIYLMMAENLRRNGFRTTYYGNRTAQLAAWCPQLSIKPYPNQDQLHSELQGFDLVLYSPPSFVRHASTDAQMRQLAARYVLICLSRNFSESWRFDHAERLKRDLSPAKSHRLERLASCSGSVRYRSFSRESMVEIACAFMAERMGLEHVSADVRLHAPQGLQHRRHRRRVVICPDSSVPDRKDWTPSRIVDLAVRLKARGLDPKIVASPENVSKWRELCGDVCEAPALTTVDALARYLYESAVVVASDSGSGHLASFLRVPTVTIHRRMNPRFTWRPGWAPGAVVTPIITLGIGRTHVWRPFVPTATIVAAVEDLRAH